MSGSLGGPHRAERRSRPAAPGADPPYASKPAIQEGQRRGIILTHVAQPIKEGRCPYRSEDRSLGVPAKVGGTIAGCVPNGVHGARRDGGGKSCVPRQR